MNKRATRGTLSVDDDEKKTEDLNRIGQNGEREKMLLTGKRSSIKHRLGHRDSHGNLHHSMIDIVFYLHRSHLTLQAYYEKLRIFS